jgi:hypothetical protein
MSVQNNPSAQVQNNENSSREDARQVDNFPESHDTLLKNFSEAQK